MTIFDLMRAHARAVLDSIDAEREALNRAVEDLEKQGRRIIDGGQESEYDDAGMCSWSINDWRTGDILAAGRTTPDEMDRQLDAADPGEHWHHIDGIDVEVPSVASAASQLSEGLRRVLQEWIEDPNTPPGEIAELAGRPVIAEQLARINGGRPA